MTVTLTNFEDAIDAGTPVIAFDIKTTGMSPDSDCIVSFCAIKCIKDRFIFKEIDRISIIIKPNTELSDTSIHFSGLEKENIENGVDSKAAYEKIHEFCGKRPLICGFNSELIGIPFLQALYKKNDSEFKPFMHFDIREHIKPENGSGLKQVAQSMGVSAGIFFTDYKDSTIAIFRILKKLLDTSYEKTLIRVKIEEARYWTGPTYKLKRIYLTTTPAIKAYYDVYKGKWVCDNEYADVDNLICDALFMYGCKTVNDFVKKIMQQGKSNIKGA